MRKLKITGVLRTVLLVLTVTGILLFFLFTSMDRRKLQRTVDDTIAFARARIQRYEDFNTNDRVKSLIRLLDKSTEPRDRGRGNYGSGKAGPVCGGSASERCADFG